MKRFLKIILRISVAILLLILLVFISLRFEKTQTYLGQKAANYLSNQLNAEIKVERLKIGLWEFIELENILIKDQSADTLLYAEHISSGIFSFISAEKKLTFNSLTIDNAFFNLQTPADSSHLNLKFIIDYFNNGKESNPELSPFTLDIRELEIKNSKANIVNQNSPLYSDRFNPKRIGLTKLNARVSDFLLVGDSISLRTNQLSVLENSGLELINLESKIAVSPTLISLQEASIHLNESAINGDFSLQQPNYQSFSEYQTQVQHDLKFNQSSIKLSDINQFIPGAPFSDDMAKIKGEATGTLNQLDFKNIHLTAFEKTRLTGDFQLSKLSTPKELIISSKNISLQTSILELENDLINKFTSNPVVLPKEVRRFGSIDFNGAVNGRLSDLNIKGNLNSDLGAANLDAEIAQINGLQSYKGTVSTLGFDLTSIIPSGEVKSVAADLRLDITGNDLENLAGTADGTISELILKDQTLRNITLDLVMNKELISGEVHSNDQKADVSLSGRINLHSALPEINLISHVYNLDLAAFGIENEKIASVSVADIRLRGTGSTLDNFNGILSLTNSKTNYIDGVSANVSDIYIDFKSDQSLINLTSDALDLSYTGSMEFGQISDHLKHIAAPFTPMIDSVDFSTLNPVSVHGTIKDYSLISELVPVHLDISENSSFNIQSSKDNVAIELISDYINFNEDEFKNVNLSMTETNGRLSVKGTMDEILISSGFVIRNGELSALQSETNSFTSSISWDNGDTKSSGHLDFIYGINEDLYRTEFIEGIINLGPITWKLDAGGRISSTGSDVSLHQINLVSGDQRIYANGSINTNNNTELDIKNLDLSALNFFTPEGTSELSGLLNGQVEIENNFSDGTTLSDITIDGFKLDDIEVGDIKAKGNWNSQLNSFELEGNLTNGASTPLSFEGTYFPFKEENPLNAQIHTKDFNLNFLSAFVKEQISEFDGTLSGEIAVTGDLLEPQLKGSLDFNNAKIKIDYLNTTYFLNEGVGILPDMFILENIELIDEEGNKGSVVGTVLHENFKKWNYDVFIDLEDTPFLCMNTTVSDNELFYGKAYGTGFISIFGYQNFLEISANLQSQANSTISMPLGDAEDVVFEDFVSFIKPLEEELTSPLSTFNEDMTFIMNLEIDVTEDAEFQMVFDQVTGDVMKGSGNGHLSLYLNENSEFEMYGNLAVTEGSYLFTLQNLINKRFDIKPGGTISWYGDPFLADIDLDAIYKLSAPLYDILGSADESYKKRIPVELIMELDGKLLNPGIHFDIDLPNTDDLTKSRVNSAINSEEERNKQAFSLLVLKKFIPTQNTANTEAIGQLGLAENSSEFLSSQLNNWLSQITDQVDIGINYRPGDDITSQEIALALSTQLFQDRLYISGNFGVTDGTETNPSSLIGDVRVEYLLVEDKIRLLVYNESNTFNINTSNFENSTTQGVGLVYKEDFENWEEFISEFKSLLKSKKAKKKDDL